MSEQTQTKCSYIIFAVPALAGLVGIVSMLVTNRCLLDLIAAPLFWIFAAVAALSIGALKMVLFKEKVFALLFGVEVVMFGLEIGLLIYLLFSLLPSFNLDTTWFGCVQMLLMVAFPELMIAKSVKKQLREQSEYAEEQFAETSENDAEAGQEPAEEQPAEPSESSEAE